MASSTDSYDPPIRFFLTQTRKGRKEVIADVMRLYR